MNEKELIFELGKLNNIQPDPAWKDRNREVLLNQIFSGKKNDIQENNNRGFFRHYILDYIGQPVGVMLLVVFVIVGSGLVSWKVSEEAKPGDSLYIAKMISEKTRSTLTFNDKEKTKLSVEFASNRVKEISQVLAESDKSEDEKVAKVEKLTESFKQEIATAKNRLAKISGGKATVAENDQALSADNADQDGQSASTSESGGQLARETDDSEVFSANLGKDSEGVDISEADSGVKTLEPAMTEQPAEVSLKESTSTEAILNEAEKLFNDKDYAGAISKLEQVSDIIDDEQAEKGEVKGESESNVGTSTNN